MPLVRRGFKAGKYLQVRKEPLISRNPANNKRKTDLMSLESDPTMVENN